MNRIELLNQLLSITIWKTIEGYENYEVSICGQVRNVKTKRILRPRIGNGYYKKNMPYATQLSMAKEGIIDVERKNYLGEFQSENIYKTLKKQLNKEHLSISSKIDSIQSTLRTLGSETHWYEVIDHLDDLIKEDDQLSQPKKKELLRSIIDHIKVDYDNTNKTWYSTNFLALGPAGVPASVNGMSGSWNSFRFTQQVPALFPSVTPTIDKRALFYTTGQTLEVNKVTTSTDGYSAYKYRNVKRDGTPLTQNNTFGNLSDIDFPVFRLAEIYLTYAEAV